MFWGSHHFQGLFFQKEILISNILSLTIFLIFIFNKKYKEEKIRIFNSPYDYIGLLFILAYLLPIIFFQWAHLRDSIDIFIRYTNYFAIYLMVKDLGAKGKYKKYFTNTLILGSLVVAIIGILGATGYINLEDVIMGNRISSTFQYPNTLAALMMAMFFLVNGSIHKTEKYIGKLIYGAIGFIMLFTFIFTYSRAAWLLFPIFALLYLIFLSGKDRIGSILYFIAALVANILVLQAFTNQSAIDAEIKTKALMVFFIGLGIFIGLYSIVLLVQSKLKDKYYKLIYGFLGVSVIGVAAFAYMALNTTEPLVFDNLAREENHTNQIQRTIKNIEAEKEYTLKLNVESISEEEKQWPFRVRINSVNQAGELELIEEYIPEIDRDGEIDIPFTTLEDTQNLSMYFTNTYARTKVAFNHAKIIDDEENLVENIKLNYKYIPESLIARFNSIDLTEDDVGGGRLTFYKDSFSIFKSKPIFGGGGGTWNALYSKHQSMPYTSTEAHNYFLQTLVETGIIGIGVLALLIIAFLVHLLKAWKKKDTLTISILFSILALLAHSGLDFNFSFHSIPLIFWGLIGLLESNSFEDTKIKIKKLDFRGKDMGIGLPIVFALPLLLASISLYSAFNISVAIAETINEIPLEETINKMEKAVMLDPFHPNMRIDLGKAQRAYGLETNNFDLVEKAENNFKKAVKHSPYMPVVLQETAGHYVSLGQFDEAFKYLDKSTETAPLKKNNYETKSDAYSTVADYYLGNGEIEKAVDIFTNKMLKITDEIREANENTREPVQLTQNTLQNIFRARYFVDNQDNPTKLAELNDIVYMSYLDLEGATGTQAHWRKGNAKGGKIHLETSKEGIKVSNIGENYGFIHSNSFDLEPDTPYKVEVVFSDESTQEKITTRIMSNTGERVQVTTDISLENLIDGVLRYEFRTTEDIEPGSQYVRFDHPGNSGDYLIIESVVVKEIY